MLGKQCLKPSSTMFLLVAALAVGACATPPTSVYRANDEDTRNISPAQARKMLVNAPPEYCLEPRRVTYKAFKCGPNEYPFSERPTFVAVLRGGPGGIAYVNDTGDIGSYFFRWNGPAAHANALDFTRAWHVMARAGAVSPEQQAAFEQVVRNYHEASVKPVLPEEAVKFKVQAELAVQQKRFDEAVDLFEQALLVAPWWPAGHYNRGLILGELKDYQDGIRELQNYLRLEPDAANARAVQLKVYQWESLVPPAVK